MQWLYIDSYNITLLKRKTIIKKIINVTNQNITVNKKYI